MSLKHISDQEIIVFHDTSDSLKANWGANVPGEPRALVPEHLPQPPILHLLGTPPEEIFPRDGLENFNWTCIESSLEVVSERFEIHKISTQLI